MNPTPSYPMRPLGAARRFNRCAALLAALFALAGIEMLASQALAQRRDRAPAPAAVSHRCAARIDVTPDPPRERQPFCTLFHCQGVFHAS